MVAEVWFRDLLLGQRAIGAASDRALHDAPEQIRSSPAFSPPSLFVTMPRAPLFRGNNLRMALLRLWLAYIIVAVLRSTALRRVVDGSLDRHRPRHGETSSSLHPDVDTVSSSPFGVRALRVDVGAPPTAQERSSAAPLVRRVQKAVIRTFAREVDKPFHIIAGTVGHRR
jgi:hypothetical protein